MFLRIPTRKQPFDLLAMTPLTASKEHPMNPAGATSIPSSGDGRAHFYRAAPDLLLAILIGFSALGGFFFARANMSHSFWLDETDTARVVSAGSDLDIIEAAMTKRPYPPLYFLAVRHWPGDAQGEARLRIPSAVFGALSVIALFALGACIAGADAGAAAALLFISTPGLFMQFTDANAYMLLILLLIQANIFLIRGLRTDRRGDWVFWACFSVAALLTHNLAIFHVAAACIGGLLSRRLGWQAKTVDSTDRQAAFWRINRRMLFCMTSVLCIWIVWMVVYLPYFWRLNPIPRTYYFMSATSLLKILTPLLAMPLGFLSRRNAAMFILFAVLCLLGALACYRADRRMFGLLLTLILIPIITITLFIGLTLPYFSFRYGLGWAPLICLLAGLSIRAQSPATARAGTTWRNGLRKLAMCALGFYIVMGCTVIGSSENLFEIQNFKDATAYFSAESRKDEKIIVAPSFAGVPFRYYFRETGRMLMCGDRQELLIKMIRQTLQTERGSVWVCLSTTQNSNPVLERLTGQHANTFDASTQQRIKAIEADGQMKTERLRQFPKVAVFRVRMDDPERQ